MLEQISYIAVEGYKFIAVKTSEVLARSEVFTAVLETVQFFWGVTLCCWVSSFCCSEGSWCLHRQGRSVQAAPLGRLVRQYRPPKHQEVPTNIVSHL